MLVKLIILLAASNLIATAIPGFVKKYFVDIEEITPCPDNSHMESPLRNFKYVKVNQTQSFLSYEITYRHPIDENVGIMMNLERNNKKGWTKIQFLPFQPNMCEYITRYFKQVWVNFQEASGVENADKCPIPAGKYKLTNYKIDMSSIKIPFWAGKFRFSYTAQRVDNGQKVMCMKMNVNVMEM